MRIIRIGAVAFVVIALFLLGLVIQTTRTDFNQYKQVIAQKVEQATGRKLTMEGDLDLKLSATPALVVEGVSFANADWGVNEVMLSLKRLELEIGLWRLLNGELQVRRPVLAEPQLFFETDAQGRGNWQFERPPEESANSAPVSIDDFSVAVSDIRIESGRLSYRNGVSGRMMAGQLDNLALRSQGRDEPVEFELSGGYQGKTVRSHGRFGSLKALLGNQPFELDLSLSVAGAEFSVTGIIDRPMEAKGLSLVVDASADALTELSEISGVELPQTGPVKASFELTEGDNVYHARDLKARIGKSDLSGEMRADLSGPQPVISAMLSSRRIDLDELMSGERSEASEDGRLFSSQPLPIDGLRTLQANVELKAASVSVRGLDLTDLETTVILKEGRLMLRPTLTLAGGSVSGALQIDTGNSPSEISVVAEATHVDLGTVISALHNDDSLTGGRTDASVKLEGRGDSVREFMADSSGYLKLIVGEGRIESATLDRAAGDVFVQAFRAINPNTEEGSQLECAVVYFEAGHGLATSDKGIVLQTEQMQFTGGGTVDLQTEELDLGGHFEARQGIDASAGLVADMFRLQGTLANPELGADAGGIAITVASIGGAIATGGISLLVEGLIGVVSADEHPCLSAPGAATSTPDN